MGWSGTSTLGTARTDAWRRITELSAYMKNRENVIEREIREMTEGMDPVSRPRSLKVLGRKFTVQELRDMSFAWIRANDRACVSVVWEGSFQKYIRTLADESLPMDANIKAAVQYADTQVQDTQPSSLKAELNSLQRDHGLLRFVTMFMSWSFKFGNRLEFERRAYQEGKISGKEYFSHVAHEWFLEPWLRAMIYSALGAQLPRWWELLTAPMDALLQWIPGVKDVTRMWDKKHGRVNVDLDRMLPAFEGVKRAGIAVNTALGVMQERREISELLLDIYRTGEFGFGLPVSNVVRDVNRFLENWEDDGDE